MESICLLLPEWWAIPPYESYVCIYPEVQPYIFNSYVKDSITVLKQEVFEEKCKDLDEVCMALSNLNNSNVIWGSNEGLSCWNYMDKGEVREALVKKWEGYIDSGVSPDINSLKKLIMGIHLVSFGNVSLTNPCVNLSSDSSIDKRIFRASLSDLALCPVNNSSN